MYSSVLGFLGLANSSLVAVLDQRAQQEEGGLVGNTGGLLHVVGHDDHRVILFQLVHQILDAQGAARIQSTGGLIHQQHVRLHRQRAGDAQALLLAAGKAQRTLLQPVLHLVPDGGAAQALLHQLVQLLLAVVAVQAGAVGHVVVDAHGERIGLLEHHADAAAQVGHVHVLIQNILAVEQSLAGDAHIGNQIVHPVQGL